MDVLLWTCLETCSKVCNNGVAEMYLEAHISNKPGLIWAVINIVRSFMKMHDDQNDVAFLNQPENIKLKPR